MQRYNGQLINQFANAVNGNAAAGAQVTVKVKSSGATATLYATNSLGGGTLPNPLTTDSRGYFGFYAPDGVYTLDFNIAGTPQQEIQLQDVADLQAQFDNALANAGYIPVGTFAAGCTVSQSNGVVSDGVSYWRWDGALPKTVTAGSSPTPTGVGNWILISANAFANDLAATNSTVPVGGVEAGEITKTISTVPSTGGLARNIVVSVGENTIDPATQGSGIFGVGWETLPNKIGAVAKPVGTDGTNAAEWGVDSGYASATINNASVATISGGYDHINNQIAGTIGGGGHNFIQYNAGGHSFIGGGSYNWIQAGRSTILAGTNNRINGQVHNTIVGGLTNKILNGSYQFILSGKDNIIDTTDDTTSISNVIIGRNNNITGVSKDNILLGRFQTSDANESCAALGGTGHDITGSVKSVAVGGNEIDMTTTQYCGAVGGDNITMTGATYCFSGGGFGNTQTARSSAMIAAEDCTDNGSRGLFTGRMAEGLGGIYQTVIGARHPSYLSGVKTQHMRVIQAATTTGTSDNAPADQQINVGNSLYSTVTGTCFVTARNVTDGKSAGYKVDFVAQWDGTSYFLNGSASDLAMTVIYQNVSSNITAPTLAFSAGALRVRFGGTASKTVHWSAVLDFILQRN